MCVHARLQVRTYGLDDGDVYMSSYENRFRLFSSVEYDGQLYMTPLNFIESVTLNEPKSECTAFTLLVPTIISERTCADDKTISRSSRGSSVYSVVKLLIVK